MRVCNNSPDRSYSKQYLENSSPLVITWTQPMATTLFRGKANVVPPNVRRAFTCWVTDPVAFSLGLGLSSLMNPGALLCSGSSLLLQGLFGFENKVHSTLPNTITVLDFFALSDSLLFQEALISAFIFLSWSLFQCLPPYHDRHKC